MVEKEKNIKLLVLHWITFITNLWFSIFIENFWFIHANKITSHNGLLIIILLPLLPILSFIIFDYIFKKVHWIISIIIMLPMWYAIQTIIYIFIMGVAFASLNS